MPVKPLSKEVKTSARQRTNFLVWPWARACSFVNSASSSFSKVNAPKRRETWRECHWIRIGFLSQITQSLFSNTVCGLRPHFSPVVFSVLEKFIIKQHFPWFSGNAVGKNDPFMPRHQFPTEFFVSDNFVFPLLNPSVFSLLQMFSEDSTSFGLLSPTLKACGLRTVFELF